MVIVWHGAMIFSKFLPFCHQDRFALVSSSIKRFQLNNFVRAVTVLASGAALAQAVGLLASPVLTRLYTPAEYGAFALFISIITSVAPVICGRYEEAIVIARTEAQSEQLLGVSLFVALSFSLVFMGIFSVAKDYIVASLNAEALDLWLIGVPPFLLLTGIVFSFTYYSIRLNQYAVISKLKLVQTFVVTGTTITLGILGAGRDGLLLGNLLGLLAAVFWLLRHFQNVINKRQMRWGRKKSLLLKRYRDFPIYNASTGLLDGITVALPVFFLSRYFPEAVVGQYALLLRVALSPLGLISTSVSQVYLKKIADLNNQKIPIRPYLYKISLALSAIVAPFAVILIFMGPDLFSWVFGESWREAGFYAQFLMPAIALRFVVSTMSITLGGTGNNRLGAIWKVAAFIVTAAMFTWFAPRLDVTGIFIAMLITDIVLYLFYYLLIWKAAGHPRSYC